MTNTCQKILGGNQNSDGKGWQKLMKA